MKKRILGGLLAAMLILGLMAPAALAEVTGAAAFTGFAKVGADFAGTCTKAGGTPTGKGLAVDPTTMKNNVWSITGTFTFAGTTQDGPGLYTGGFDACGYLTAPLNLKPPLGASCVSTKGHRGIGSAHGASLVPPGLDFNVKLYDLNWKAAIGGTILLTGSYQELASADNNDKKPKYGILYAYVQAAPDAGNPLGCLDKTQTDFTIAGIADLLNTGGPVDKSKPEDGPGPLGPKKCGKSNGPCPAQGPRK